MRIMVCGGPRYSNRDLILGALGAIQRKHGVALVIHGSATVIDMLAEEWAMHAAVPHTGLPGFPDYKRYEPFERLQAMIRISRPDAIIAFPDTPGIDDLNCRSATSAIPVWEPATKGHRILSGPRSKMPPVGVSRALLRREWYRGAVYIIGAVHSGVIKSPFKVGRVAHLSTVEKRLDGLQTGSAHPLAVAHVEGADISSASVERMAHVILAPHRMEGEWFNCSLATAIAAVQAAKARELSLDMWPKGKIRYAATDNRKHNEPAIAQ